jgi:SAM-dependent methyltransferase
MDLVEAHAFTASAVRHPWERARLRLTRDLIERHVALRAGDVVLDVGCGDTYVAESLARLYPDVQFYAVDSAFSDSVMDELRRRLTVPNLALFNSLDAVPDARPVALILLMDVIEHVPDDVAFLRDIGRRPLVGERTWFLMTVPSFQALFSSHDRFLGHYRRYTVPAFRNVVGRARLSPAEEGYFFMALLPLRLVQLIKERVVGEPESFVGLSGWRGGDRLARFIEAVLTLDGRLALAFARAGIRLPGLSNFAICRKSA